MRLAIWSFSSLNAGVILVIVTGTMFLGAGYYNLMPLIFHPGNNGWNTLSVAVFLIAQVLISVGITLFCINIVATVFSGKIAAGLEKTEQKQDDRHSSKSDGDKGRSDFLTLQDMPSTTRWVSTVLSFMISWVVTIMILRHYSSKLRQFRHGIVLILPLIYFLLQFLPRFQSIITALPQSESVFSLYTFIFTFSKPI
jgi:hypothetical protein